MDRYEWIIAKALMGDISHEEALMKASLLQAVQQQMFCHCGQILDVRRAGYAERTDRPGAWVGCQKCAEDQFNRPGSLDLQAQGVLKIYRGYKTKRRERKRSDPGGPHA